MCPGRREDGAEATTIDTPRGKASGQAAVIPSQARKDLMAIAIDCFARYGYQGTSIDRIASAAGVTKGALYYHFRDKEELLFEAVKDRIAEFEQRVVGSVNRVRDPAAALAEIARVCVHIATKNNLRRFILTLMVEALDTHPKLSEAFRGILRRFRNYLAGIVRLGQEQGVFRADVDPARAAALFAGGVIGAELQHYQDPERVDLAVVMDGVVEQLTMWLTRTPRRTRRARQSTPATTGGRTSGRRTEAERTRAKRDRDARRPRSERRESL